MEKNQTPTTFPSDRVIHIEEALLISKVKIIDRRNLLIKFRYWLRGWVYVPRYSVRFKFVIPGGHSLRPGDVIITTNARWFVIAKSPVSLICEPVEDMTLEQIWKTECHKDIAILFSKPHSKGNSL